jgi:hypothetical protein
VPVQHSSLGPEKAHTRTLGGTQVQDFLQTSAGKAFTYPCAIDPSGAVKGYPVRLPPARPTSIPLPKP